MNRPVRLLAMLAVSWGLAAAEARADTVQLVNGDHLSGEVMSLDVKELKLNSSLLGSLSIGREKIRAIYFGDVLPSAKIGLNAAGQEADAGAGGNPVVKELKAQGIDPEAFREVENAFPELATRAKSPGNTRPEDVVRQLREQGLDESVSNQIKQAFPLLGASGAQQYFDSTVSGLISGEVSIDDIRNDAINARDQLLDLQEGLGPGGKAALSAYMSILNRFIRETEPPKQQAEKGQKKSQPAAETQL